MAYEVINTFKDLDNNNHLYKAGKPYPIEGYKPTKKRIAELMKVHPQHQCAFIKEVKEENKE